MPNRILKESICTSDSVEKLSWFEEVFFYRLIVNCDDYGRMDARLPILRARLFPLKNTTNKDIKNALQSLRSAGLIDLYEVDGRSVLQMRTWEKHQQIRARKSKYPAKDSGAQVDDIKCNHLQSDDIKCNQVISTSTVIQSESESESNPNAEAEDARAREASAPAAAADEQERVYGFDGTDLTTACREYDRAGDLVVAYKLPDTDQSRAALIEDAERVGWEKVEAVLKAAALGNSRPMLSVNFYRKVLENDGRPKPATGGGREAMLRYSPSERKATYSAAVMDFDGE